MSHLITDGKIFGSLVVVALVASFTIGGCGATPEGKANKAAGKQTSPAAGRVVKKMHADSAWRLVLLKDGNKRTIYVKERAWIKCQLADWYAHETCD
jgi:hypothetical protein